MNSKSNLTRFVLLAAAMIALGSVTALNTLAQSGSAPWTAPANVSRSGAASQPIIAAASNGTLHVMWWDSIEGEKYARTTGITQTQWSSPIVVPQLYGARDVVTNTQTGKVTVSLTPPREIRMAADTRGNTHVFWFDSTNQLWSALAQGAGWGNVTTLSDAALKLDVAADVSGTLHLAYIKLVNTADAPTGVYYRVTTGNGTSWDAPSLVYASPYFRTLKPDQVHVSVAGDGQGRVLVTWDDPRFGQSYLARSTDAGRTWSEPQALGNSTSQAFRARAVLSPFGDFLLLTQDAPLTCDLSQRRSTDAGQTWSAPERVLTGISRCPARWSFAGTANRLWLIGMPSLDTASAGSNTGMLSFWDGSVWSDPLNISLAFRDVVTGRDVSLGCLGIAIAQQSAGIVGCDSNGDIWAARNAVQVDTLAPALKPVWSPLETLSDPRSQAGLPAMATDGQGKLFAMWSQSTGGDASAALYAAVWDGSRWSRAARVLRSPDVPTGMTAGSPSASKTHEPSIAYDREDRLHAVWSGGLNGTILYSWAYARDAGSEQGWAKPIDLPSPSEIGSWPFILAEPHSEILHVIYAVPYNEGRGIYHIRSSDGGNTWGPPDVVFDAAAARWDSADQPRLALDVSAGVLHAVWLRAQLPGGVGAQAVYYSRSTDGGKTWNAPLLITEGWVNWPRVALASAGQVYIAWNQSQTGTNPSTPSEMWGQFSPDGGESWTEPAIVRGFEAMSGPADLASDGVGGMHLAGVGQGPNSESVLLYSQWDGRAWGEVETAGLSQNATPENAAVAVPVLPVNWMGVVIRRWTIDQDNTGRFQVVVTGKEIATVTVTPASTFTPLPTLTGTPTATPLPTSTPRPQLLNPSQAQPASTLPLQGQLPLVAGGILVIVIVASVVAGRLILTARR